MKTRVLLNTVLGSLFLLSVSLLYSQSCTQCDNTGDPPGTYASEIGQGTTASGDHSFAGGFNAEASGHLSFAFGGSAVATGTHSAALGVGCSSTNSSSFAIGAFANANATRSIVIGHGMGSGIPLENNISHSIMLGIGSDLPTVFIGDGSGVGSTGKVGIGNVTEPQAKLHIKADDNEIASVFIEPHMFTGGESTRLRLGTMDYGISAGYGRLYFNTGGNYIFHSDNANVGIGTYSPHARLQVNGNIYIEDENSGLILKSPDGQCWQISVNNDGTLNTNAIDCDQITESKQNIQSQSEIIRIYPNPARDEINIESVANCTAEIRDMNGVLLLQKKMTNGNNSISLKNLRKGYYLLTVSDQNQVVLATEKIVKQ